MSNTILILTWTIRQMWAKVHIKVKTETVNIRTEHTEKKIDSNEDMNGWLSYSFCGFEIKFLIFIRFHAFCERITRLCSLSLYKYINCKWKKDSILMREWENWMIQLNDLNEIPPSTNFRLEILMAFLFSMVFFRFL